MTTLAALRAKLNGEMGIEDDAETSPWSKAVRNAAISDGYAELWRVGVRKDGTQDIATVANQRVYDLTSIRQLHRLELLDSDENLVSKPKGIVEPDGTGAESYHLVLRGALATGYTLRVYGWSAYASTFADDSAEDDLPAEHNRIPLLKAKAILWRAQLAKVARYKTRSAAPPEMNLTVDQMIGLVAAAEREFADEARVLSGLRPRAGQIRRL